jgi:dTDP-4-dehydrorhamnose reductase
MKRILVTGGRGMLGRAIGERFPPDQTELLLPDLPDFDVTQPETVAGLLAVFAPEVVVHCAAMTDVDGCERDPDAAHRVNRDGSAIVAKACRERGVPLVYVSTDFVFDGTKGEPYSEHDVPRPLSVYGWSKLRGEEAVRGTLAEHCIVRTAWTFAPWGHNFVRSILRAARERPELRVVDDQVGSPTYAPDLAEGIWRLIAAEARGTIHLTNAGTVSRYDFAREIVAEAGLDVPVRPIRSADLDQPARRPAHAPLVSTRLATLGLPPLRPYREALRECVAAIKAAEDVRDEADR